MEKRAAMNEEANEGLMIEACQKGDREAFRQLFEMHKDRVWSIALHFMADDAAARDITQQVFLKLLTGIGQFRKESGFSTWLYRMVVNACLDEHRKRKRFISFDFYKTGDDQDRAVDMYTMDYQQTGQRHLQEDCHSQLQISTSVKAAIKELKPKLRITILLKYFEGMSYEEMSQALGCSTGTVASRLNRGHKELARRLAHLRQ